MNSGWMQGSIHYTYNWYKSIYKNKNNQPTLHQHYSWHISMLKKEKKQSIRYGGKRFNFCQALTFCYQSIAVSTLSNQKHLVHMN